MPTITASTSTLIPYGNDKAEDAFGQECALAPKAERHQHETRESGQLEFDEGDEELDRQHEEGGDEDHPGEEKNEDLNEVLEE